MELKKFAEELQNRMKVEIDQIALEQHDVLVRTSQIIFCIESQIMELKHYVLKYKFESNDEEIDFFKTIKPVFISQLWYHKKLFKIRLFESFNDTDSRMKYYRHVLKALQKYVEKHEEFYHYTISNDHHMDEKFFTRCNTSKRNLVLDDRFSTIYDNRLSRILSNELIKDYVLSAIQKIQLGFSIHSANPPVSWTASKTDLIELMYALHASGVFNKASSDLKQIAKYFETVFNVTLGNYSRVFQEIRLRKSGQTNFIDEIRKNLMSKINESGA